MKRFLYKKKLCYIKHKFYWISDSKVKLCLDGIMGGKLLEGRSRWLWTSISGDGRKVLKYYENKWYYLPTFLKHKYILEINLKKKKNSLHDFSFNSIVYFLCTPLF